MLGLLAATLFPFGPAPGPLELSPRRTRKPWRVQVATPGAVTPRTFDLPKGVLLVVGSSLALLDPLNGAVRWRATLKTEPVESVAGSDGDIALTVPGSVVHLGPKTGQILRRTGRPAPGRASASPYPFPPRDSFAWRDGRVVEYGEGGASAYDEDGPVGLAYVRDGKADLWNGGFLKTVVRGPAGTTIGDLKGGEGDDDPQHGYFARAVCADGEGVWAVRQALGGPGRLVRILASGRIDPRLGPVVDPTQGLPAWTREGIVYARAGAVYRFDGHASHPLPTFPRKGNDACDPATARPTRWGLVRTGSLQKGAVAWTAVRLDPL